MNRFLHGVARAAFETFDLPGPILEIGSYQVVGQEALIDLRRYFPSKPYVGLDMRPGPGVDRVGSVEELPFDDHSFGTVIAMSTFEHVRHFWRGFAEVRRVLRPNGVFLVSCPFHFHIHAYPSDYWRFTPEAFKLLLDDYPSKLLGWHGPADRPANVWALAFAEEHPAVSDEQIRRYRQELTRHAREPMSALRKLRYRLGRLLCGSRPFAPWLLRETWHLEVLVKEDARHAHPRTASLRSDTDDLPGDSADGVGVHCELELQGRAAPLSGVADLAAARAEARSHRRR